MTLYKFKARWFSHGWWKYREAEIIAEDIQQVIDYVDKEDAPEARLSPYTDPRVETLKITSEKIELPYFLYESDSI